MLIRLSAVAALILVLAACQTRPPLRYVERHYHHVQKKPYYATDPYSVRRAYYGGYRRGPLEGTQMRQAMNRDRVMHGSGCYPTWCPRGGW